MKKQSTTIAKKGHSWQLFAVTIAAAFSVTAVPELSFAAERGADVFSGTLCDIAGWFTSSTGKAIATIAIIFLGIAAFFGKVTWGLALMFAVGIFAIFGASSIVEAISDGDASCDDAWGGDGGSDPGTT